MPATTESPKRAEKDSPPVRKEVREAADRVIEIRERALRELAKH